MEPKWKTRQEQRTNRSMDEPPIPPWGWPAGGDVHPTAWQHSLEYFLVADLLQPPSKRDPGVAAVRVRDPAHADVFLVPFFASTMVNLLRRKNFPTYKALASQEGMRRSRFCLHVEGDTPSSSRFFNAIMSGCVPVVVSDYVELPFESAIDYSRLTLFFSQQVTLSRSR
ncbi:unnamed protein product [Closterium sp. Naga37s-1]|nr:unnamed protein product [Closterium sp. Naga37s-1]